MTLRVFQQRAYCWLMTWSPMQVRCLGGCSLAPGLLYGTLCVYWVNWHLEHSPFIREWISSRALNFWAANAAIALFSLSCLACGWLCIVRPRRYSQRLAAQRDLWLSEASERTAPRVDR